MTAPTSRYIRTIDRTTAEVECCVCERRVVVLRDEDGDAVIGREHVCRMEEDEAA